MNNNIGVRCDVEECIHNDCQDHCKLSTIKVTCGCGESCTCCGDYKCKD